MSEHSAEKDATRVEWENSYGQTFDITTDEARRWQEAGVQGRFRFVTTYAATVTPWSEAQPTRVTPPGSGRA